MSKSESLTSDKKLMMIIEALAGQEFTPMTVGEISGLTGLATGTVNTKLTALKERGWVEKHSDRYHLGQLFITTATRHYHSYSKAMEAVTEKHKRLTSHGG